MSRKTAPKSPLARHLGEQLKAAREERRKSQVSLSEELGISDQTLGRIERGLKRPSVENLKKICDLLNVSADQLLGTGPQEERLETREGISPYATPKNLDLLVRRARKLDDRQLRALALIAELMTPGEQS